MAGLLRTAEKMDVAEKSERARGKMAATRHAQATSSPISAKTRAGIIGEAALEGALAGPLFRPAT